MKQALSPENPARVRRGQFRAITLGLGASALAMACSFGEIDSGAGIQEVPAPTTPATTTPESPEATPGTGTTAGTSSGGGAQSAGPAEEVEEYDANDPFASEIGKQVKSILEANCSACHVGGAANPTTNGGINYMLDVEEMIKNGKIVPGAAEDSQLYVRMVQRTMPPAFIRDRRPTEGQMDVVAQWINELEVEPGQCGEQLPFMSLDDQIALMAADIQRVDENDKPFTRYLNITYLSNAGECELGVQRQRYALFKGINSVSTEPTIGRPQPIDQNETIYRIDIRDYNWNRDIDLEDDGVVDFDDGWDAIVDGLGDYAVEFIGDQADDLKEDAQTAVPFLSVNAFIQFTNLNDLYYTLTGAKANLFDFELEVLGIDTEQEILDNNFMRAGYSNSGVSKQERVLNRFDSGVAGGYAYWISFDFDGGGGRESLANESIYEDPLGFQFAGGEAIYNLPNGLQAYYVANDQGTRLGEAPVGVVIDPAQNNGVVVNGASCHSCHNSGMITFTDQVRQYVVENRVLFDNDTYEDVLEVYPEPNVFRAAMDRDSELHVSRTEQTGVPRGTPDPISRVFLDFQLGNLDARLAAGELQVTQEELVDSIALLDPRLSNLGEEGGYVDRNIFTDAYLDSLCILHAPSENQPANCP